MTQAKRTDRHWHTPDGCINIEKHFQRLHHAPYTIETVFDGNPGWPGDREGRALLAFLCHHRISGRKIPCLEQMMRDLPARTNPYLFFGDKPAAGHVNEQQLSGHNWYLRGLTAYAETFRDPLALRALKSTFENLYLPALPLYDVYPLERTPAGGGVDGNICGAAKGWALSTDVGCAFMCVDGVARYYVLTKDERARVFLEKVIDVFLNADMVARGFQTHTSLTCLRGILSFYETTRQKTYLQAVRREFDRYVQHGMTLTYENFNWFRREDTWTEPCAVVDSLLLAVGLYRVTREERYRVLARRIWANGLQFCQRDNGGVGTNKCVTPKQPVLKISGYEAPQCCSMRYAEALLCYSQNKELFLYEPFAPVVTESDGRRFSDDRLIVWSNGDIRPIFSCNTVARKDLDTLELQVLF
ncbi:MAG: hypothetical protein IJL52_05950 [Clostridia bacterium]|nr:hypothetical protein [Clostridia bacterium]